jgi:hypothetical protein
MFAKLGLPELVILGVLVSIAYLVLLSRESRD